MLIILIAGIVIGVAVLILQSPGGRRSTLGGGVRRLLTRSRPEENVISRDLNENSGGSRHIPTQPIWRDHLE
ncbi:hypothetical protein [Nocardia sp. NPDC051570]|uniref:hypothetical protein n=1 Tax=Nocardia sp. NPDC051570 TaxID=3364324 RepID=UPI0037B9C2B3